MGHRLKCRLIAFCVVFRHGNKNKAAELWTASKATLNASEPYAARILRALGEDPELQIAVANSMKSEMPPSSLEYADARVIAIDSESPVENYSTSETESASYEEALDCARKGDFSTAERLFRQVTKNEPDNFNAMMNLGKIYTATSRHNIASAIFLKALKIDSRNIHALRALANSYSEVGMHSLAKQISEQVKTNYPDQFQDFPIYGNKTIKNDPRAVEPMVTALLNEGLINEALAVVQGAISEQAENNNHKKGTNGNIKWDLGVLYRHFRSPFKDISNYRQYRYTKHQSHRSGYHCQ